MDFSDPLLRELLNALSDSMGHAVLGDAVFEEAHFQGAAPFAEASFAGKAWFGKAKFSGAAEFRFVKFDGPARFRGAHFAGKAHFDQVSFERGVRFENAQFDAEASFTDARFVGDAWFDKVDFGAAVWFERAEFSQQVRFPDTQFHEPALFDEAKIDGEARFDHGLFHRKASFDQVLFGGAASFEGARFDGMARLDQTRFADHASFAGARFNDASQIGALVCARTLDLSGAIFTLPVTLQIAAGELKCARTQWESTATLQVRYARVNLAGAVLSAPLDVTAHPVPFMTHSGRAVDESLLSGRDEAVQVVSVRGLDAAHLVLTDTDLSNCQFRGAFHLDQIRIEGRITFAKVPKGIRRRFRICPVRWSQRRTVAEEHYWRAQNADQAPNPDGTAKRLWRTGPDHDDPARTPDPDDVTAVYRQLRKAFEDSKNEPGAADFYYGEMEMRRHDRDNTSRSERGLLHVYWLLSGYGLRASRAAGWLTAAMITTVLLLMGLGLPQNSPRQEASGNVPAGGGHVTFTIDKDDPQNPTHDRFTDKRFEKALNVTLNSVIFRSSGQDLTTTGTYIEMGSRLLEPVLLALAVLAVRGRIKR
ncbi:pentapeptide repeat-containing protein [Streptomyces sp. NBC_01549]|uniref:pentapeptide repeat-containing protein n=1 Tax=Streptomyces sp. NBC_01549 TaxID=2975874 RepID=UPI002253D19F|nr:pentapeptide repeat-containing protein [Streptomyces sp. NBC_01549]MCX4598470.1 pentapeptide repeat-containing protein [Streptomyces sp. NBC_01549]